MDLLSQLLEKLTCKRLICMYTYLIYGYVKMGRHNIQCFPTPKVR